MADVLKNMAVIIEKRLNIFGILLNTGGFQFSRGRCGCDCIVVRFITTYAIIARQISETIVHHKLTILYIFVFIFLEDFCEYLCYKLLLFRIYCQKIMMCDTGQLNRTNGTYKMTNSYQ
jgi:hypothetical protein